MNNLKNTWEYFGENDPYFAVSFERYRNANLTDELKEEFFLTGEAHVARVFDEIETNLVKSFKPKTALDFGCGVGRLVIPLASRAAEVIGVDISEAMLDVAADNCEQQGVKNARFLQTNDFLAATGLELDFVHSVIVFQHIKPKLGLKILTKMITSLNDGGVGALHFTYSTDASKFQDLRIRAYQNFPLLYRLRTLIKMEKHEPMIPMHVYHLNDILAILHANNCHNLFVRFSHHGYGGVVLFFQKVKLGGF